MNDGQVFIDYYNILQVSPDCDAKILESAYHYLAKRYHPDHTRSADTKKLNEVIEAYRALRDPERRADYDLLYSQNMGETFNSQSSDDVEIGEKSALDDADDHARILTLLYSKRRESAQNAGVVGYYIQDMLKCSDEHFEFHKWYLKEKGFIVLTEQGTLAITIQGVDHVISMSRTTKAERLQITQSTDPRG
ncbi:DnaJ domain-containing protein [Sphingomonas sp. G124]|uniref:DnaJ domain-containing protein n=1 Tax=Sphingomonas cremea TaxID=2904799 RepID=A0A9X1QPH2_9SPHN|nr:DnaJ domain-containing protein [Sphingomonas cremea]MCF2515089.1 DnaJ domain-containing protein [Sphingomonas cremea]